MQTAPSPLLCVSPLQAADPAARHIPALDGVRGLAILLVLAHHFGRCLPDHTTAWRIASRVTQSTWCGVDLFFALSGFLITGILLDTREQPHYFRNFYMRRVLRIFPLYFGVLLLTLAAAAGVALARSAFDLHRFLWLQPWLWTFTSNCLVAMRGDWVAGSPPIELNHFWSLAVEEQFYLLWPALLFLLPRRGVVWAALVIAAAAALLRCLLLLWPESAIATYVLMPCRVDALAMGGLIAMFVRSPRAAAARRPIIALALASLAGLLAIMLWNHQLSFENNAMRTAGFSLLAVFFACLIYLTLPAGGLLHRWISAKWLRFLGKYSYGLYVYHHVLLYFFFWLLDPGGIALRTGSWLLACACYVTAAAALSIGLAWLSYQFYERPFLRLKRFF